MAHFYGSVQGMRGEAARLGSSDSGMETYTASWSGAVRCYAYVEDGRDCVVVSLVPWHGHGVTRELYRGPINGETPEAAD